MCIGRECNVHHALRAHNDGVNDIAVERRGAKESMGRDVCVCASATLPYGLHLECTYANDNLEQFWTYHPYEVPLYTFERMRKRAKLQNEMKHIQHSTNNGTNTPKKRTLFHHGEMRLSALRVSRCVWRLYTHICVCLVTVSIEL